MSAPLAGGAGEHTLHAGCPGRARGQDGGRGVHDGPGRHRPQGEMEERHSGPISLSPTAGLLGNFTAVEEDSCRGDISLSHTGYLIVESLHGVSAKCDANAK